MTLPADFRALEDLHARTRLPRIRLKDWERIHAYEVTDTCIRLVIETYDVKVLTREDRYNAKGLRMMFFKPNPSSTRWHVDTDVTIWDDDFVPYVYEKFGRRKTADEFQEQREWEKLCHRPGTKVTPLDSYDRVSDPLIRSTPRMERHF